MNLEKLPLLDIVMYNGLRTSWPTDRKNTKAE